MNIPRKDYLQKYSQEKLNSFIVSIDQTELFDFIYRLIPRKNLLTYKNPYWQSWISPDRTKLLVENFQE